MLTGIVFAPYFIGEDWVSFWAGAVFNAPGNHVMEDMEHIPRIMALLPTIVGVLGIALAYVMYVFMYRLCRPRWRVRCQGFIGSC